MDNKNGINNGSKNKIKYSEIKLFIVPFVNKIKENITIKKNVKIRYKKINLLYLFFDEIEKDFLYICFYF